MASTIDIVIPNEFICPISLEIMLDPVICEDGHTYDRESIGIILNDRSPITRQPINKNNLIPNRALRHLIESFLRSNPIIAEGLKEREEKARKEHEKEELERKELEEKKRKEQKQLEIVRRKNQIITTFNSKDLPIFNLGYCQINEYNGEEQWIGCGTCKFKFGIDIIDNIKNSNINELDLHYKKLCVDLEWIEKYICTNKDSESFVDYVYDLKEKKSIENKISFIEKLINQNKISHLECIQCANNCGYLNKISELSIQLKELIKLNKSFEKITNPIEYYYQNYKEFLNILGIKDFYHLKEIERGGISFPKNLPINLDSINSHSDYCGNQYYYHILHEFDRQKLNKIDFLIGICYYLNNICSIKVEPHGSNGNMKKISCCEQSFILNNYLGTGNLIMDHINYIKSKMITNKNFIQIRQQMFNSAEFNEFFKFGKILVNLIESIKPNLIIMKQNN